MRAYLRYLLESGPYPGRATMIYRMIVTASAIAGTGARVLETVTSLQPSAMEWIGVVELIAVIFLTVDLVAHIADAMLNRLEEDRPLQSALRYLKSPGGLIDLVAALPYWIALVWPIPIDARTTLGVARFLKLARYSPALSTLESVIARESRPLRSALFIMMMLILITSTALYMVERGGGNGSFSSIPGAMWWAVITLTTLGYGDVVPMTALGKVLAGCTAVLGVGMFALPASILATGFAEEMRRRDFLHTWSMVARVPLFAELDAEHIAAIANLLRFIAANQGDVLVRAGEMGERMFFLVSGEVRVDLGTGRQTVLEDGDFFGEIALLHRRRRTATVTARTRCELLALDSRDFRQLVQRTPRVAEAIARTARERMDETGITFSDADDERDSG